MQPHRQPAAFEAGMSGKEDLPPAPERTIKHSQSIPARCEHDVETARRDGMDMPDAPQNNTQPSSDPFDGRSPQQRLFLPSRRKRPSHVLFSPELFCQAARGGVHIIEREHVVLRDISTQNAALRKADWQGRHRASCSGVINKPIGAKPTDAVEALAGFKFTLCNGHHFANGAGNWRNGRIAMNDRSTYSRSYLDVGQMIRRVEDIVRPLPQLIVSELGLLQRRLFMNNDEGASMRCSAQGIVDKASGDHLVRRQ